jgi:hypothetical protein
MTHEREVLPRAQLELEFQACVQEREMLLGQLARLIEDGMATVPSD